MAETQTDKSMDRELAALRLERERLELEDLRERVGAVQRKKDEIKQQNESRMESYRYETARRKGEQATCAHRKGGLNVDGFAHGDDTKHSIGGQRLPNGKLMLICTRCQSQWLPGDADYERILALPTDNTHSSSVQFRFEKAS